MRNMGRPRAADASGGTVTRLFNRLFLSSRTVTARLPTKRAEAFVAPTVIAPASGSAATQPSSSNTYSDTSRGRRETLEQQMHREHSSEIVSDVFGYSSAAHFSSRFDLGEEIARGGNGTVRLLIERRTGQKYACKTLPKKLHDAGRTLRIFAHVSILFRAA